MVFALVFWSWVLHQQMHQVSWNFSNQSNYHCSLNQIDFNEFQLSLHYDSLQRKLVFTSNIWCKMSNSYTDQQKYWTHSFKIMIYLLGLEVPISFIQKSIIKYLFEPVDFFYTLLKICKSLSPQPLIIGSSYSTSHLN